MDSKVEVYLKRARTEIDQARILFDISSSRDLKGILNLDKEATYYSGAISHAYYAIFYSAKATLLLKGIETEPPFIHSKTFGEFCKNFIDSGILDMKLLEIYREMIIRADYLMELYKIEKGKRTRFTYNTISQANMEPAKESIENARIFFKHIYAFCERF